MGDLDGKLERLGRELAGADGPDSIAIAHARRRLLGAPSGARRPLEARTWAPWAVAATAAGLAIGALALSWQAAEADPVTYRVEPSSDSNGWIAAERSAVPVHFSEGTTVELQPGARARIGELRSDGATVHLERGTLSARVRHRAGSRWIFHAGPYAVRVTGTRFEMSWDAGDDELRVRMYDGSVVIDGPLEEPMALGAGEELRASGTQVTVRRVGSGLAAIEASPEDAEAAGEVPPAAEERAARAPEGRELRETAPRRTARDPAWRVRLRDRDHDGAIRAAERAGFHRVLRRASVAELYRLADSARFVGRIDRSRETLLFLRGERHERGRTAFMLGRIAARRVGGADHAATWFRRYLREEPRGALAESALGRLLEIQHRRSAGDARQIARQYLDRFPRGAHAALARRVSDRSR